MLALDAARKKTSEAHMNEPLAHVSPTPQRAAELFALVADAIQFLGRTAWPVVDLSVRFWIAMPAIVSSLLLASEWNTALTLAVSEYPISWLDPRTEAHQLENHEASRGSLMQQPAPEPDKLPS
jgi:hypothetical protein